MVNEPDGGGRLDDVFQALAHEARRTMLIRLAAGDLTVGELAAPLQMSAPAVTKHVKILERAGLVRRTVAGRRAAGWLSGTARRRLTRVVVGRGGLGGLDQAGSGRVRRPW